jgi:hypothetical protein
MNIHLLKLLERELTKTDPASRLCAILIARDTFSVKTAAASPYEVLFAHSVTSDKVQKLLRAPLLQELK